MNPDPKFYPSSPQSGEPWLRYEALIDYLAARQAEEEFGPDRGCSGPTKSVSAVPRLGPSA